MQQFSNQEIAELKSRVDQIHELLASRGDDPPAMLAHPALLDQLSFSIEVRRIRRSHFGADMSGPVWDMMLDLMLARAKGRVLGASDLATGAGVPLSSGLRMIAALESHGLVEREIDERDRRRTLVRLSGAGAERMASYFERIDAARRGGQPLAA
ncbi:helix-turn-helix domain-containing protein [Sphingopyxis alaskensis]|jgi:DNA-binding MarR family transcriptional regulator|uniref:Transcriptional regulator, MarR family n=1 Tax=Sphingopyxis alaskensis (strain DSM 13593 / LMG 18877 / RB2256) TaxID=317655 RepID=Q1GP16_SPHAL|nr:helix-turn-helix domain-containing protein [Sphingopyxis alaskensis]ABF54606.1 transcriptional regulator, MarR family [Sphingopyxis alaskensis RB2256]MCM3418554.1 helix-turn-helix domain-containing protein [Sphingopyxis alaskensis]